MITQILAKVLPVLVMIALGRICATKGILNDDQHAGLKNIIGDILLPVVLFQAFFTADYGTRMLLVFALVFARYGAALAAGYGLRRFVKPYDRFMPLLMTSAEGGMLGYALYALLCGADQTKTYAMVDIGQTVFGFTVFLTALKAAGVMVHRHTLKNDAPRGIFCAIGRCTDCVMIVDGQPNVRTCVTPLHAGMKVQTQYGVSAKE